MNGTGAFEPVVMFRSLERHRVEYVLIGGLAAVLHGSPLRTNDAHVCPNRERGNLERLADALTDLDARLFTADGPVEFTCDAEFLERVQILTLATSAGRLDVSFRPTGVDGYAELVEHAVDHAIEGVVVPTAALDDVIRSKRAADREKDRAALPTLEALREALGEERDT